jgi:GNAT superfamily N-acetyltransferase
VTETPADYREAAKSYASLWVIGVFFAAAMALDIALGSFVAHLPGWAIAIVLVVGVYALFIYAARSEKSLTLTADELRVGQEAIARADITAVADGIDEAELPVLGWPNGAPRGLKGLTLRLTDGRDVVVPTRFAARLSAALGVGEVRGPAFGTDVRAAARSELPLLLDIDDRAEAVFRTAGYELPPVPSDVAEFARAKAVFVAGRPPVGFVSVIEVDGLAHIAEIAVVPKWMRQGIGTRLLERACAWARAHDYPAVTLTTFADVPWNGPYYAARGFSEIEPTPGLAALRAHEADLGLDAVAPRIAMRRDLPDEKG